MAALFGLVLVFVAVMFLVDEVKALRNQQRAQVEQLNDNLRELAAVLDHMDETIRRK